MSQKLVLFLTLLPCLQCQMGTLYFPDDNAVQNNYGKEIRASTNDNPSFGMASKHDSHMFQQTVTNIPVLPASSSSTIRKEMQQIDKVISRSVTKLTLAINKELIPMKDSRENIVFAPVSIAAALGLVLLGANGKTFEEITTLMSHATGMDIQNQSNLVHQELGKTILNLKSTSGFNFGEEVNFAAGIFVQYDYPIRTLYRETANEIYESEVLNVDFRVNPSRAQQIINAWVAERTKGKISQIMGEVPSVATRIVIASAMYFKAAWERPFFEGSTAKRPFYPNGRKSTSDVMVEMMANGGEFPYHKDHQRKCEIIGLPYKGNSTVMYVVMPFDSNIEMLKEFEKSLTEDDLVHLADSTSPRSAVMLIPKMKIESTIDLNRPLQALGLKSLFDPDEANLGLLSPGIGAAINPSNKLSLAEKVPLAPLPKDGQEILIFSRTGELVNCSTIFNQTSDIRNCSGTVNIGNKTHEVHYKKIGDKIGRRIVRSSKDSLDDLRRSINRQSTDNHYQNPGLYADQVIHKVYMDITETGTEAAASTSVSLTRDGSKVTFRADVPFLFFIRHEDTKTILFWGSVNLPTPHYK